MKQYCFQLSTGVIFRTTTDIVYNQAGYSIDRQAVTTEDSLIDGEICIPGIAQPISVKDMVFSSSAVVATWIEE